MYTEKHVALLVECLKGDETNAPEGHSLTRKDWKGLVELATRQCVSSLLYRRMETHPDQIPHDVLAELRVTYFKYGARSMVLYNEFTKIFKILYAEAVPFIVLKGADLGETVYGDAALRPVSDLDLLIQLGRAYEAASQPAKAYDVYRSVLDAASSLPLDFYVLLLRTSTLLRRFPEARIFLQDYRERGGPESRIETWARQIERAPR